jgi:hypothetical protein
MAVCDGCGREDLATEDVDGLNYCGACADYRAADPAVTVAGRTLPRSEALAQGVLADEPAEDDDADAKPARRHR